MQVSISIPFSRCFHLHFHLYVLMKPKTATILYVYFDIVDYGLNNCFPQLL